MKKGFNSTDPQSHKGESDVWLTPLEFVDQLGEFDLDPCAHPGHQTAKRLIHLPTDGLAEDWAGRVWLNPPYGRETVKWLEALRCHGNGIALIFARLETNWIQPYLAGGFFVVQGRLSFESPTRKSTNAGTGSILIPFGKSNLAAILASDIPGRWFQ